MSEPQQLMDMLSTALNDAVRRLEAEGYVVSGEICFIKPKSPGRVQTQAVGYVGQGIDLHRLHLQTVKIPIKAVIPDQALGIQNDSPSCPNCGHLMVRQAGCYKCVNCGEQGGCG